MHGGASASRSISHISLKDLAPSCLIAMSQWRKVIDIKWSMRAVRYSSCLFDYQNHGPIKKKLSTRSATCGAAVRNALRRMLTE